jgi:hypothetical protein
MSGMSSRELPFYSPRFAACCCTHAPTYSPREPQVVLNHDSPLLGKTLSDPGFADLYHATVVGVRAAKADPRLWSGEAESEQFGDMENGAGRRPRARPHRP